MIILPFLYCFFLLFFWLIHKILRKISIQFMKERFFLTSALVYYYFQPSITNALSDFLNCTKVGENYYLSNYLNEECTNNNRYLMWVLFLVLPSFVIYAIIFPGLAFFYMFLKRNKLYEGDVIYKVGFMLNGFAKEKFYW